MSEKEKTLPTKTKKKPNPYLMLFIGALITALFTFGHDLYKSYISKKIITVTTIDGGNKIKPISNTDILKIDYQLVKDSTLIKSFFEKTIILSNKGKEGIEDIQVNISTNDTLIVLIESPEIITDPKEINTAMDITVDYISDKSQKITIPLLNSNQSAIVKYKAYSKNTINSFNPLIGIHKKDIELEYSEGPIVKNKESDYEKIITTFAYFMIIMLTLLTGLVILSYKFQRKIRNNLYELLSRKNNKIIELKEVANSLNKAINPNNPDLYKIKKEQERNENID